MTSLIRFTGILLVGLVLAYSTDAAEPKVPAKIDYNRDVRPILSNNCYACHGPDEKERKAKLRIDTHEGALAGEVFVAGKPQDSTLIQRVISTEPEEIMPPPKTGKKLTAREIAILQEWIKQGAEYATHWSYAKPIRPPMPTVTNKSWVKNPIDHFILAELDRRGLKPQLEADRTTLIRRLSLDLTGLPPTVAEVDTFVKDRSPNAYEKLVDRLLAKPAYGEHWARMWLDLARYADSAGYADDPSRTIWAYRDWVIKAFNTNMPFDQFTVEQLAGDLLPNPTDDQLTATAFHRNTLTNNEGGTSDEEFRNVAVVDRVNTTMAVWMGTSMACAQCHTHKYDPITQTEYFRFLAFLNNTADADRTDETPVLGLGDTIVKKWRRAKQQATITRLDVKPAFNVIPLARGAYLVQLNTAKAELAKLQPMTTVPILRELPANQKRVTKLQFRGNYLDLGPVVTEGVPAAFPTLPKGEPLNRLTLAKWLISTDNPLTARVTVNRFWESVFGTGLVRTSEDFGSQGEAASHPELLDWLAVEFSSSPNNWNTKAFLKLLVTSAAYRQSSKVTPEALERDPDNRFLARGPRFRMSAEMVRDQALAVSGLLSPKMYGPSVKPPQPTSGLSAAFGGKLDWQTSGGEDKFRRGLYTEWRRTSPYPSMSTFDAPSREACTIRRGRTNTPLQALVTLNDPVYVEAAQALGRKMAATPGTTAEKLTVGFRQCVARPPSEKELARLIQLFEATKAEFIKDLPKATKLATEPIGAAPKDASIPELAAWTVVGNVLLNLDEMLMRR